MEETAMGERRGMWGVKGSRERESVKEGGIEGG